MPLNDIINGAIEKLTQRIEELKTQIGNLLKFEENNG